MSNEVEEYLHFHLLMGGGNPLLERFEMGHKSECNGKYNKRTLEITSIFEKNILCTSVG